MIRAAVLVMLMAATARAETVGQGLASPWTTPARTWLITGLSLTAGMLIFEDQIVDPAQSEATENKLPGWADNLGDMGGQLIFNGLYTAGMFAAYEAVGNHDYLRRSGVMLKASAYAVGTSTLLKYVVHEQRPNRGDYLSFPSGHSTAAFVFASVVASEHGLFPYGIGAISLAVLTAYSRMSDNKHYLHDVTAGATIGTVFGIGTSYLSRESKGEEARWQIFPLLTRTFTGVAVQFRTDPSMR